LGIVLVGSTTQLVVLSTVLICLVLACQFVGLK
jgi:hypothetical protein